MALCSLSVDDRNTDDGHGLGREHDSTTALTVNYIYSMVHSSNGGDGTITPATAPFINYGYNATNMVAGRFQLSSDALRKGLAGSYCNSNCSVIARR